MFLTVLNSPTLTHHPTCTPTVPPSTPSHSSHWHHSTFAWYHLWRPRPHCWPHPLQQSHYSRSHMGQLPRLRVRHLPVSPHCLPTTIWRARCPISSQWLCHRRSESNGVELVQFHKRWPHFCPNRCLQWCRACYNCELKWYNYRPDPTRVRAV